jgi:hypothetical protein
MDHTSGDRMSENEGHAEHGVRFEIRIVPDAEMPNGMNVVPVEQHGRLTVCVRERHISEDARDRINTFMTHATCHGMLEQGQGGPHAYGPPPEPA